MGDTHREIAVIIGAPVVQSFRVRTCSEKPWLNLLKHAGYAKLSTVARINRNSLPLSSGIFIVDTCS